MKRIIENENITYLPKPEPRQIELPLMKGISDRVDHSLSWRISMEKDLNEVRCIIKSEGYSMPIYEEITKYLIKYSKSSMKGDFEAELKKIVKGTIYDLDIKVLDSFKT